MNLRERIGLGLAGRLLARLSLAARAQELEAERDEFRGQLANERQDAWKAIAERDEAQRKLNLANGTVCQQIEALRERDRLAEDLRKCHHEAEAELEALRRELAELKARQVEVIRIHEEELAAKLLLPERRSWPDLLDAVERTMHDKANAEQRAGLLEARAARPTGDATLLAQLEAKGRHVESLLAEVRKLRAELARASRLPRVDDIGPDAEST